MDHNYKNCSKNCQTKKTSLMDTMSYEEAEKIFLQKMRVAEETITRGEYMTSAQVHKFLKIK